MSEKPCELAVRMASAPIVIRGTSIFSTLPFSLPVAPGAQACVIEVGLGLGEVRTCVVRMVHHFLWCVLGAWSPCNSNSELSAVGHTCFFVSCELVWPGAPTVLFHVLSALAFLPQHCACVVGEGGGKKMTWQGPLEYLFWCFRRVVTLPFLS